ncbi:MAG: glycine C-acetyltransferase [Deltaproteobacteria bacterium]|nr:glycine C-acetyltransferase [Deltaproteobacteria bacterium]
MAYSDTARAYYDGELKTISSAGLFKHERYIHAPQGAEIEVEFPEGSPPRKVINMCANNYLGLSSHAEVVAAAHGGLGARGYGMSSVRFICGTQDIHRELENRLTAFLGTEDTMLFSSCFDANGGVFEALLNDQDAVISDRLVHASIIDGLRLCKARREIFEHSDMAQLEEVLRRHADQRFRMIVTDGVFSMDGDLARLDAIVALAERYDARVVVDDSHAAGVGGKTGRGTHEQCGVVGKIDIITTTLGKALGGASGGCVSGRRELVAMCRQRARPYLFSNTLAPVVVSGTLAVMDLVTRSTALRDKLEANTRFWRKGLTDAGFDLKPGDSPIVPVMLYNARLSQDVSRDLFDEGVYAVGFFYPVVPKAQARIRTQLSAAHDPHHLEQALQAFIKVGQKHGILGLKQDEIIARFGE